MNATALRAAPDFPALLGMQDVALSGRRVLIRVDFNVPLYAGRVAADQRIRACLPTIHRALQAGAAVILMSHLGRPVEGCADPELSLAPVARCLEDLLAMPVRFTSYECLMEGGRGEVAAGEVVLLENIRFAHGEKGNNPAFAKVLASLCDVFVMDAFGCAHRAHASTHGVIQFSDIACAGPLLQAELAALAPLVAGVEHPVIAVVGGSKVSTKLGTLKALCEKVDCLVPAGGIANTLLVAANRTVGASLYEPDSVDDALQLMDILCKRGAQLLLPDDVVCAVSPDSGAAIVRRVDDIAQDEMILDIGPRSCEQVEAVIKNAATVLWNGPLGVFEQAPFATGTRRVGRAIAASDAYSVAGGGDTLAAIEQLDIGAGISYVSTGGGALLKFIEQGDLPCITALREKAQQ